MKIVWVFGLLLLFPWHPSLMSSDGVEKVVEGEEAGTPPQLQEKLFELVKMPSLSPQQEVLMRELVGVVGANITDDQGRWPLIYAVMKQNLEAVDILLTTQGINVNKASPRGMTALHNAVVKGGHVLERLLQHVDINLNFQANDGSTPLHIAVSKGAIDSIRMLLARGRSLDLVLADNSGATPKMLAHRNGKSDIVALFENFESFLERLNLPIRPLKENVGDCLICLDTHLLLQKLHCEHSFCGSCLLQLVTNQYNTNRLLLDKIACPDPACSSRLNYDDISAIIGEDALFFEAYKKLLIRKAFGVVLQHDRLPTELAALIRAGRAARHDACGAVVMKDAGCSYVNCSCGVKFCYKCGVSTPTPGHDCTAWRSSVIG